jgi:hypothetical protein
MPTNNKPRVPATKYLVDCAALALGMSLAADGRNQGIRERMDSPNVRKLGTVEVLF